MKLLSNFFHKYPYTNFHELNLDWVLSTLQDFDSRLDEFEALANELKEITVELAEAIQTTIPDLQNRVAALEAYDINKIISDVDAIESEIDYIKHQIESMDIQLNALYQYVDDKDAEILAKHKKDFDLLQLKMNQIKVNLQSQIDYLKDRIDSIDTDVFNPWMNKRVSIQENQNFTYNHLADECLTAEQYISLNLTASDYAALDITSRDYQEFGKDKTHFNFVFSPVFGFKQEINNVLSSIVNYLKGTMTASEYASLDITASEYTALDLSSEDYFSYNPFVTAGTVTVSPTGVGLTNEQYAHLSLS